MGVFCFFKAEGEVPKGVTSFELIPVNSKDIKEKPKFHVSL